MAPQKQKQLPDAMLTEVWTMMHLAVAANPKEIHTRNKFPLYEAEGCVEELQSDSPSDGNVGDIQAMKEAADKLLIIGDTYSQSKEEESKLIDDLVECLQNKAQGIDEKLERELCLPMPSIGIFETSVVSVAYSEVSSRLEHFLVGDESLDKIALVTHITKGVSAALRNISAPAISLAAALSYRFVTEKYANLILESGGLRNLVTTNSQ